MKEDLHNIHEVKNRVRFGLVREASKSSVKEETSDLEAEWQKPSCPGQLELRSGGGRSHPQGLSSLERASSLLSSFHKADTVG